MLSREQIATLLPHDGRMVLLDSVERWTDSEITCSTRSHLANDNPLRRGSVLPALCGIEYGAQAMAVHGALVSNEDEARAGVLASLRNVRCRVGRLDDIGGALFVDAKAVFGDRQRCIYEFTLRSAEAELMSGQAAVFLT